MWPLMGFLLLLTAAPSACRNASRLVARFAAALCTCGVGQSAGSQDGPVAAPGQSRFARNRFSH